MQVVKSGVVTRLDRARAWNELQTAAREGKTRPFYRAVNKHGLMYAGNTIPLSLGDSNPKPIGWSLCQLSCPSSPVVTISRISLVLTVLLSVGGLDKPIFRPFIERDWRFGHYEVEGLQDPLSRLSRYMLRPLPLTKKARRREELDDLVVEPLTVEA